MNWAKVDAALAAALADAPAGGRILRVFVHVDPATADAGVCARLGVGPPEGAVRTATLSAREVAELSELAWVRRLALSGRARLLAADEPDEG